MSTITIPKTKYEDLKKKAMAYEYIARLIEQDFFAPPPTKNITKVIKELENSGRYTPDFLRSVKRGLERSSYFRK